VKDPSIDPKAGRKLLQVLDKELSGDTAGRIILKRFRKTPAKHAEELAKYLHFKFESDKKFEERVAETPDLPPDMRTIIYGGQVERLVQIAEAGTVIINQGIPLPIGLSAIIIGVISLTVLVISKLPKPTPPMSPGGFNVAVAEFAMIDSNGKVTSSDVSREFSNALYTTIETEIKRLPAALQVELRGPNDVGVVADNAEAAEAAEHWKATMLIYGNVKRDAQGFYQVEPQFYITDTTFSYGSEVTGPEYLGQPVTGLTLGPDQKFVSNTKLNARSLALQSLIRGLAYFSIHDYGSAEDAFQDAVDTPSWDAHEGQEVAYLLLGTVRLRSWDLIQNPDALPKASDAFNKAYEINPNYVRNYLGLGAVAIAQAQVPNEAGTGIGEVKKAELLEAIKWYSAGLDQTEPAQAYIPTKAALGLGQAYLLGDEFHVLEDSRESAQKYFKQVVETYDAKPVPDLAWFAAHAHAGLGRIAGLNQNWSAMSDEYGSAITILRDMQANDKPPPDDPLNLWIARFWSMAGFAEAKENHLETAQKDYEKAIEIGSDVVSEAELKSWQDALGWIKKRKP
jgi:tetratricopeptide (TPR) repeat protein